MDNKNFLAQLILKATPDVDDAGLEIMITDAEPILQEWVYTNIIAKLNESQRKELIKLTDGKNYVSWSVYKYLESTISWYEDFIKNVYEKFEKMYLENFKDFSKGK